MAAAAGGASESVERFRSKYIENVQTLYSDLSEKLVGHFSWFKSTVSDSEIKELRNLLNVFLNWQRKQTGGVRYQNINLKLTPPVDNAGTYTYPSMNINFEGNNVMKTNLDTPNVLILGGGPAGLYAAILLKTAIPTLNVLVLENRVSKLTNASSGTTKLVRKLDRGRFFLFETANLIRTSADGEDDLFDRMYHKLKTSNLGDLFILSPTHIDLFKNLLKTDAYPRLKISFAEYLLAAHAQSIGVKIHHVLYDEGGAKNSATVEAYLRENFLNHNLLAIFDATGGRIYDNFKDIKSRAIGAIPKGETERIPIYESAVNPDIAVRVFPGTTIPFIGIGDSIVRANYVYGNGLAINGSIILFYTILFFEYFMREFGTGVIVTKSKNTRKMRRLRRSATRKHKRSI